MLVPDHVAVTETIEATFGADQTLPSRSSNTNLETLPDSPCACVKRSIEAGACGFRPRAAGACGRYRSRRAKRAVAIGVELGPGEFDDRLERAGPHPGPRA